jgi:hypothetical protein
MVPEMEKEAAGKSRALVTPRGDKGVLLGRHMR